MVLAAALISVAVLDPQAPVKPPAPADSSPQTASDSRPYTVSGVRAAMAGRKAIDYNDANHVEIARSAAIALRNATGASLSSRTMGWSDLLDFDSSEWQRSGGGWHEDFVGMVGPQRSSGYGGPYYGSTNGERLVAVASSVAIGWALAGIASLVQHAIVSPIHHQVVKYKADRKQKKIEKVRAEIRAELAELERVNAAARASGTLAAK
jgi:hypothetical protein